MPAETFATGARLALSLANARSLQLYAVFAHAAAYLQQNGGPHRLAARAFRRRRPSFFGPQSLVPIRNTPLQLVPFWEKQL